ncbi:MAG: hypothetical protein LBQ91_06320 [Oscillospiraceae bacterium]|nr:hypothetical protein [Oscillospiraceae bacterium]
MKVKIKYILFLVLLAFIPLFFITGIDLLHKLANWASWQPWGPDAGDTAVILSQREIWYKIAVCVLIFFRLPMGAALFGIVALWNRYRKRLTTKIVTAVLTLYLLLYVLSVSWVFIPAMSAFHIPLLPRSESMMFDAHMLLVFYAALLISTVVKRKREAAAETDAVETNA